MTDAPARRSRRRKAGWLALLVAFSVVAAACGGDDDDGGTAATGTNAGGATAASSSDATTGDQNATADDVDPEGVFRYPYNLGAGQAGVGVRMDPATSAFNTDLTLMQLIFGTLMRETEDGTVEPWMAESVDVVDPQTVTFTLREGVTFTDGSPYDAEAVRTSLLRTRDQATEHNKPTWHAGFKFLEDVVVDSPTQVTVKLNGPGANEFLFAMAHREGSIVSPQQAAQPIGTIDEHPIGAGPYILEEFRPEAQLTLRKNPDFWDADNWRIARIEFVHVTDPLAGINALQAGTIDYATIPDSDYQTFADSSQFELRSVTTDYGYVTFSMCPSKPPFDKIEVREAVRAAIDRDALNTLVYQGRAKPTAGLWPDTHPNYNPAVEELHTYDPDKAKELLAAAGASNVSFELWTITGQNHERIAEVLQQQLAAVGFDVEIVPTQNIVAEFLVAQRPGAYLVPGSRQRVDKYNRLFAEGGVSTVCGEAREDIMDVVRTTAALAPDDPATAEAYQEAELMWAEWANPIPLLYLPQHYAWNTSRVGGEPTYTGGLGLLMWDSFYIKK